MPGNEEGTQPDYMDQDTVERLSASDPQVHLQSYLRFRDLLEAAPDAIFEVDRDGTIVLLNAAAEKMFGYQREELLGTSDRNSCPAIDEATSPGAQAALCRIPGYPSHGRRLGTLCGGGKTTVNFQLRSA